VAFFLGRSAPARQQVAPHHGFLAAMADDAIVELV
jgi:hypothetical protein